MQPYFMPYIGYFQMINAVDKFVFYDDVNFIKQGWINRNKILVNKRDFLFTVPIDNSSQNGLIKDAKINDKLFSEWKNKLIKTLYQNYKKAPHFDEVNSIIENILQSENRLISRLAINSVIAISNYLDIKTVFIIASEKYNNKELDRLKRLLDICKEENAEQYINAMGGQLLYAKEDFLVEKIQLNFIKSNPIEYKQFSDEFLPFLSIIDVLMFNPVEKVKTFLDRYELL